MDPSRRQAAQKDVTEQLLDTFISGLIVYIGLQKVVHELPRWNVGTPPSATLQQDSAASADLKVDWVAPFTKNLNAFRQRIFDALSDLARIVPTVREHVRVKVDQASLRGHLQTLRSMFRTLRSSSVSSSRGSSTEKVKLEKQLRLLRQIPFEGLKLERQDFWVELKGKLQSLLESLTRSKNLDEVDEQGMESAVEEGVQILDASLEETPLAKSGAASRVREIKSIADYLEWHEYLQNRQDSDLAVSQPTASTLRQLLNVPLLMFTKISREDEELPRPYPQLEELLNIFRDVMKEKAAKDPIFRTAFPATGVDQWQPLSKEIMTFVEDVRRNDLAPGATAKDQPEKYVARLKKIEQKALKLQERYMDFLESTGRKSKRRAKEGNGYDVDRMLSDARLWNGSFPAFRDVADPGVPPAASGRPPSSDAPAMLYRKMKPHVVLRFTSQLDRFLRLLLSADAQTSRERMLEMAGESARARVEMMVLSQAEQGVADAHQRIAALEAEMEGLKMVDTENKEKMDRLEYEKSKVIEGKVDVLRAIPDTFNKTLETYLAIHTNFARAQHKDGLRYMLYWRGVHNLPPENEQLVRGYFDRLVLIKEVAHRTLMEMHGSLVLHVARGGRTLTDVPAGGAPADSFDNLHRWADYLDEDAAQSLIEGIGAANSNTFKASERISAMYNGEGESLAEILMSGALLLAYGLKAVRVLFLYMALSFAENVFQMDYARKVYGENRDPPHPVRLVWMALGIELAISLVMLALLYLFRLLFGTTARGRSLDNRFFLRYTADYVITTVVLLIVTSIVGGVIRQKKYFRYRYEGERGVRALSEITFWSAVVVLAIPFFQLF